jgi:hypothetical protein
VTGQWRSSVVCQRLLVSLHTADCGADLRSADVSDTPAPLFDQVRRSKSSDQRIVDTYEVRIEAGEMSVDKNQGRLKLFDSTKAFG